MANVNIPDLAALTAPAATDEIEVYDASAAANVRLALSYVALLGTANVFTEAQTIPAIVSPGALTVTPGSGGVTIVGGNQTLITRGTGALFLEHFIDGNTVLLMWGSNGAAKDLRFGPATNENATGFVESMRITSTGHVLIGTTTDSGQLTVNGAMALVDGMTAPGTTSGWASIYVDSADGDLKVKFGDGTVKTLATDT